MEKRNDVSFGFFLILIGLVFFAGRFFDNFGLMVMPALGLGFIAWSIASRNIGLLIPGGILSGIGLGTVLLESNWVTRMELSDDGGVFLVSFALGWFLITLLSILVFQKPMWWPMIPGGIMAVIGSGLLVDERILGIFSIFGNFWPLILVAVGIYIIWRQYEGSNKEDEFEVGPEKYDEDEYSYLK